MVTQAEIEAAGRVIYGDKWAGYFSQLKAALEAAAKARWQPIENAPKDEPILLGWRGMRTFAIVAHWIRGKWRMDDDDEFGIAGRPAPKWWQPLPEPPESA